MRSLRSVVAVLVGTLGFFAGLLPAQPVLGQSPGAASAAPGRQSGTVQSLDAQGFVLSTAAGQTVQVQVPDTARILLVDPATHDVKAAQPGTKADISVGDRAIVTGSAPDGGQGFAAIRVYLLKSGALAALHASQEAAWAQSVGGVVKTVDAATGTLQVVNGARSYRITTTPATVVRRYAPGSVRFDEAVPSELADIRPGDQVQARGQRSSDGSTLAADEIVAGSFAHFSGTLTAVDAAAGTVSLKDLATKKPVTVSVTSGTNLRHLPANVGGGAAAAAGGSASGSPAAAGATAGEDRAGERSGAAASAARRMDLSRLLPRLPTQTLAELKPGDAVMIVATENPGGGDPVAINLLSGVDRILAASPAGTTTLSPWSIGGDTSEGEGGAGSGGGR